MRKIKFSSDRFLYPLLGGLLGILYVVLDEGILDELTARSGGVLVLHEIVDAVFPVLFGISAGVGIYLLKRWRRSIERLSFRNEKLERELLFSTLVSQILHEIRNPIHNITAVIEDAELPPGKRELIQRNLSRLNDLKNQYGRWGSFLQEIDPRQTTDFAAWFEPFFEDKIQPLLGPSVDYSQSVGPVKVHAHRLLLEQTLFTFFGNSARQLSKLPAEKRRELRFEVRLEDGRVVMRLSDNGGGFAAGVLESAGRRPIAGAEGMGLGILLAHKLLEQIGGTLALSNEGPRAVITIRMAGEAS